MDEGFESALQALLVKNKETEDVRKVVREIVESVRDLGDRKVLELTARWDSLSVDSMKELEVSRDRQQQALENLDTPVRKALESAVSRVKTYHEKQLAAFGEGASWEYRDADGNRLGQRVRGLHRVGLYVPGGKAAYPSTVYMTAIPAKIAGVREVVLVVPTPNGEVSQTLLAAARLCEIDRLFTIGGAQAIAALAFGTETIPRVDKIVGPGNIYVATAKESVYGSVDVDMVAGPSEIVIVTDGSVRADWLALDILAQAEHDEMAQAILISTDRKLLDAVEKKENIGSRLASIPRKQIISESLANRSALIEVEEIDQAVAIVNRIAPEHLELAVEKPSLIVDRIEHAGAIFMGAGTPEVVGDYTAGPSHVLPTSGTARFGSPLGVYDFLVKTSIIDCSDKGLLELNRDAAIIAREEGLFAHALSAKSRLES
ncbi:MAG: histidinol dehydrogenase [Candidatus Azotimanducaceae bacterium]